VREFFHSFGDGFIKPIIFLLLGAVVPIPMLLTYAPLGIVSALAFMFVVRPLVVGFSLSPWSYKRDDLFSFRELTFISFIRETGAIPAVLILVAAVRGVPGTEFMYAIGMWVILLTLIIEPPLTGPLARRLGVAK
jgi:cell volume regulation protein A